MTYYYVYPPGNGTITGMPSGYCDGSGPHNAVFCSLPIDVSRPTGSTLYWYGSGLVRSVQTIFRAGQVCSADAGSPWKDGLEVQMIDGPDGNGRYIGSVFYAHVQSPISDGIYNTPSGNLAIGTVPACRCNYPEYAYNCYAPCPCYEGGHSHIECCSVDAINPSIGCGSPVTGGTTGTWLYRWFL
jgi:hypothetical protein